MLGRWDESTRLIHGRRLSIGYALPLTLWGFLLFGCSLLGLGNSRTVLVMVEWPVLYGGLWLGLRPLVRASMDLTAAHQGCRLEDLEPGTGWRSLLGLTDDEPWWLLWTLVASWMSVPAMAALMVAALILSGAHGGAWRLAGPTLAIVQTGSFLLTFMLAPLVKRMTAGSDSPRREETGTEVLR